MVLANMMKYALGGVALAFLAVPAMARAQVPQFQSTTLTFKALNQAFAGTLWRNGLTVAGTCTGTSVPTGNGQATLNITCPSPTGLPTIANNTLLGNVIGTNALPTGLTGQQVTNLLSQFTANTPGTVSASGGGTANFLRADGGWAVPPGTGGGGTVITGSSGTVTSVNISGGSTGLNAVGGPITGAGTLTLGGTLNVGSGGTGATTVPGVKTALGLAAVASSGAYSDLSGLPTLGTMATRNALTSAPLTGFDSSGNPTNITLGNGFSLTANGQTFALNYSGAAITIPNSALLGGNGTALIPITVGSGLAMTGGTLSSTAGGGSVTSVAASGGTTGLTFTGSPITGAGTFALAGTLGLANGGTGSTSAAGAKTALSIACTDLTNSGTACTKQATATGSAVASVTGTFTAGHSIVAADAAGTIRDGGAAPVTVPTAVLLGGNAGTNSLVTVTLGTGLSMTSNVLTATGGGGGVTASIRLVTTGTADTAADTAGLQTVKWTSAAVGGKSQVLPTCATGNKGQIFTVKDGAGTAATYPITVTATTGTLDFASSRALSVNRGSLTFQCDGGGDWGIN